MSPAGASPPGSPSPRRTVVLILVCSALVSVGMGLQRTLVTLHLESTGLSAAQIGFYLSLWGIPRALMNVVGGRLVDRFSRKWNLALGQVVNGVLAYGLFALADTGPGVALARTVMGIGSSWFIVAAGSAIIDCVGPRERGLYLGLQKFASWAVLGLSAGAAVAVSARFGYAGAFWVAAALAAAGVALVSFMEEPRRHLDAAPAGHPARPPGAGAGSSLAGLLVPYLGLGYVGIVLKLVEDGVMVVFVPLLLSARGLGLPGVSATLSAYTLVFASISPLGGRVSDLWGRTRTLVLGCAIGAAGAAVTAAAGGLGGVIAGAMLLAVGFGIVFPVSELQSGEWAPPGLRGTAIGYWRMCRDLGSFLGPLAVGLATSALGVAGGGWALAVLIGLSVPAALLRPAAARSGNAAPAA